MLAPSEIHKINSNLPPVNIKVVVDIAGKWVLGKRDSFLVSFVKETSTFEFIADSGEKFNVPTKRVQWFYP